jgi:hypothetical protein
LSRSLRSEKEFIGSKREIEFVADNPRLNPNLTPIRIDLKDSVQVAGNIHHDAWADHLSG